MGGRSMPTECPHGVIIDWGDFGPTCPTTGTAYCHDPDSCRYCYEPCVACDDARWARASLRRNLADHARAELPEYWADIVCKLLRGEEVP